MSWGFLLLSLEDSFGVSLGWSHPEPRISLELPWNQGPVDGGFQTGGLPDLDLSLLFCPFYCLFVLFGLSRFLRDSPDYFGDFPDWSFSSFSVYVL